MLSINLVSFTLVVVYTAHLLLPDLSKVPFTNDVIVLGGGGLQVMTVDDSRREFGGF